MVFTPFLKDYVHIVIDIENNGITVARAFFSRFSSIPNKLNQPRINAYCYVIETISRLHTTLIIACNSLIVFVLDSYMV